MEDFWNSVGEFLAGMGFWEVLKTDDIERLIQQIELQEDKFDAVNAK